MIFQVTIALCVAGLLALSMRRRSASLRHMVWMLGLGAALAAPVAAWLIPPVALPTGFRFESGAMSGVSAAAGINWLGMVWLVGAVLVASRFALAHARAAALVARAERVGTESGVEMRRAPEGTMPFTWGLVRAVAMVPAGVDRDVVLHELAHALRRDHWWLLASQAACCVYWFHPLVWLAAARAADERERACDDWALSQGAAPESYAETLVAAARSGLAIPGAAMAVAGQTPLETRLRAILDPATNRRSAGRAALALGVAVAVAFVLPVARAQKVYKVADGIEPPRVLSKVEPQYTQEARDARISGKVVLSIEIDEEGLARNVTVKAPLDAGLDKNAIIAVEKWRFKPGTKEGKPVRCAATVEVNFRLQN
jgi:TonB family protein